MIKKTLKFLSRSLEILMLVALCFVLTGQIVFAWVESSVNPVYDPIVATEKAYYPSVIKVGDGDYRMWYQSNSSPSNTTVAYATSVDGISWTLITNQVSGLLPDNAGHPLVKFINGKFEIWYWNAATPYGNNAMHHAESVDGIVWANDTAITGNLTTTASGQWNSGVYGAVDVVVNDSPTNTGNNPFDYKYAMYYDATSGGYEQIALGYSVDGVDWTLYGTGPVVPRGSVGAWDSGYVAIGSTVIKGNFWTLWYSGGISASNEGIGCATSVDGFEWTKCPNNPVMHKSNGVAWRNSRTYTPKIIRDGDIYKMWFTGRDSVAGNYAIGYATSDITPVAGNLYLKRILSGESGLPSGKSVIILDENEVLNVSDNANTASGGTLVVSGVSEILSSFTSGDLNGVDLSTPKNIGGKSVVVGKAIKISSGSGGVAVTLTNPNFSNASVSIPDATTILASVEWDGIVASPKAGVFSGDTAPSGFSISSAIDFGSPTDVLLFDKPVQVVLSGISGNVGYKPAGTTVWTKITTTCGGTYTSPTLSPSSFPGECSITNGTDTKILTYHLTTFGGLTSTTATLYIQKSVINASGGTATPEDFNLYVKNNGSDVSGSPAVGTSTPGTLYLLTAGTYKISEDLNNLYSSIIGGDCDLNGNITLLGGDIKTCTITNTDVPTPPIPTPMPISSGGGWPSLPLINIVKLPSPLSLPTGPGPVTYTYTVTNLGADAMSGVWVEDNKCDSVSFISGDTNNDLKLDPSESWIYKCNKIVSQTEIGTATTHGSFNGWDAYDTANATVVVGKSIIPPVIHIVKKPSTFILPIGGGKVTYTYTVTNPGTAPLSEVTVADNKCTNLPGRVVGHPGDLNKNNLLESNESWSFTCQTNIEKTTTNIGSATGKANDLIAVDFSPATVAVTMPSSEATPTGVVQPSSNLKEATHTSYNVAAIGLIGSSEFVPIQQIKIITANIAQGSRGDDVKILQEFLISQDKGPKAQALAKVGATGYFYILTRSALAEFQEEVGISPALGNFGPITRAYLKEHY